MGLLRFHDRVLQRKPRGDDPLFSDRMSGKADLILLLALVALCVALWLLL